jgi:hypothetical protein
MAESPSTVTPPPVIDWMNLACSKKAEETSTVIIVFLWIFFVLGCIKYV